MFTSPPQVPQVPILWSHFHLVKHPLNIVNKCNRVFAETAEDPCQVADHVGALHQDLVQRVATKGTVASKDYPNLIRSLSFCYCA